MRRAYWSILLLLMTMATGCATMNGKVLSPGAEGPYVLLSCPISDQVFQRNTPKTGDIPIRGTLHGTATGPLEVRLLAIEGPPARSTDWRKFPVVDGKVDGVFTAVPVGGYSFEARLWDGENCYSSNFMNGILVGDLWVLAGQSNMEGCGGLDQPMEVDAHVHAFYYGDRWDYAHDPLCWFNEAVEPIYWREADPAKRGAAATNDRKLQQTGAGCAVRFGIDLYTATKVPVGLIVCPLGGTSLAQWSPDLKEQGTSSLYGTMLRRINVNGGKVTGVLWWQGESDAVENRSAEYKANTRKLIESLRGDLNDPNLPFLMVQLSRYHTWDPNVPRPAWNQVQDEQLRLAGEMQNVGIVSSIDATLADPIHVDAVSLRRIGARLAKLARHMVFHHKVESGPRPVAVDLSADRKLVRVTYTGVNGELTPRWLVRGFQVEVNDQAAAINSCVRSGNVVEIYLDGPAPAGARLWYGRGLYPVCNLVDQEGFPAPVFGPWPLDQEHRP
jgi:sialate O-acetylesterase